MWCGVRGYASWKEAEEGHTEVVEEFRSVIESEKERIENRGAFRGKSPKKAELGSETEKTTLQDSFSGVFSG